MAAMIQRVASARGRRSAGLYAVEGTRLVERALRAGAPLESVLAAGRLVASTEPRHLALLAGLQAAGCPITVAPDAVLDELSEGRDLGPIFGLVRLPPPVELVDLLAGVPPDSPRRPLILAAVDITDPGNVGALTRTAHAIGAVALLSTGAAGPFHPRATRISRGSIFRLPVIQYETAAALLAALRACGVASVATAAAGGVPLTEFDWPSGPAAVLMGNEAQGLPPEIAATVDYRVTIPMAPGVDSYSVNAAAAIVLYAARTYADR